MPTNHRYPCTTVSGTTATAGTRYSDVRWSNESNVDRIIPEYPHNNVYFLCKQCGSITVLENNETTCLCDKCNRTFVYDEEKNKVIEYRSKGLEMLKIPLKFYKLVQSYPTRVRLSLLMIVPFDKLRDGIEVIKERLTEVNRTHEEDPGTRLLREIEDLAAIRNHTAENSVVGTYMGIPVVRSSVERNGEEVTDVSNEGSILYEDDDCEDYFG